MAGSMLIEEGRSSAKTVLDEDRTRELIAEVASNAESLNEWIWDKVLWKERRLSRTGIGSNMPYPGASDINMPLSDLYIGRFKPLYMNLVNAGVTARPQNSQAVGGVADVEQVMNYMLEGGTPTSMPNWYDEATVTVDSMLEMGIGVLKTSYEYVTRPTTELIRRDQLPGALGKLIIRPNMSEEERLRVQQEQGDAIQDPVLELVFGIPQLNPVNADLFKLIEPEIKNQVEQLYQLDMDEELDKKALKDIVSYLRKGTPDKTLSVQRTMIVRDSPVIENVPIQDFIVPPNARLDLSNCDIIAERMYMSPEEFRSVASSKGLDDQTIEEVIESAKSSQVYSAASIPNELTLEMEEFRRDYDNGHGEFVEIWKIFSYEDLGSGQKELVVSVVDPESGLAIQQMPFPADHGNIPYTVLPFELLDCFYRSPRGIPQILDHLESHATAWFRALENNLQITSTASIAVKRDSVDDPNNIEIFPGFVLPLDNPSTDVAPLPFPDRDVPIERLESILLNWADRLIGGLETDFFGPNRSTRPATATEVNTAQGNSQRLMGHRAQLFLKKLAKPLQEAWSLYRQFGPREVFVALTGKTPQPITQAQTRGPMSIMPAAKVGDMDVNFRSGLRLQVINTLAQLRPEVAADPRYVFDLAQASVDWLESLDPVLADRYVVERDQEQIQGLLQTQQEENEMLQQLATLAQKARLNVEMTDEEADKLIGYMKSQLPHADLQDIISQADAAQAALERNAVLASGGVR